MLVIISFNHQILKSYQIFRAVNWSPRLLVFPSVQKR
jgi:hypothetical protein